MPINLKTVCDELNQLPVLPVDMEFAINFMNQEIILRKKIKLPLVVATRHHVEDNIYRELAINALAYIAGDVESFDPSQEAMAITLRSDRPKTYENGGELYGKPPTKVSWAK